MSLTGKQLKDSYPDLLQLDNGGDGLDDTLPIKDGAGTQSALSIGA